MSNHRTHRFLQDALVPQIYSYIRLSTPQQLGGDGARRQESGAERWSRETGLPLNETIRDIGVSAFTGDNARNGALAEFLRLVEAGKVAPGSILVIEALDRLSRQHVRKAVELFSALLNAGIDIVTLMDGHRYRADAVGPAASMDLFMSIFSFSTGHEESSKKSFRLGEVWAEKRRKAKDDKKAATSLGPGWLTLDRKTGRFEPVPERVEVVRRIFSMAADGVGKRSIALALKDEPTWGRGKRKGRTFYESYVHKLLNDRRVLGEYQPGVKPKGAKWRASGEPIADYYPRIVEDELWWRVRSAREARKGMGGGNPDAFRSLFRGVTFCAACSARHAKPVSMAYVSKGTGKKAGEDRLVCSLALRGKCDHRTKYFYRHFELAMVVMLRERARELIGKDNEMRSELARGLEAMEMQLAELKRQETNLVDVAASGASVPKAIIARLAEVERQMVELRNAMNAKEAEMRGTPSYRDVDGGAKELLQAFGQRDTAAERKRLNERIRRLIARIDFAPINDGRASEVRVHFKGGETGRWFPAEGRSMSVAATSATAVGV